MEQGNSKHVDDDDRVKQIIRRWRNHTWLAVIIVFGIVIIGLGSFTDALQKLGVVDAIHKTEYYSEVTFLYRKSDSDSTDVLASNAGNKPAVIGDDTWLTFENEKGQMNGFKMTNNIGDTLPADSTLLVSFSFSGRLPTDIMIFKTTTLQNIARDNCFLKIPVIPFSGEKRYESLKIPCRDLDPFIAKWIGEKP